MPKQICMCTLYEGNKQKTLSKLNGRASKVWGKTMEKLNKS